MAVITLVFLSLFLLLVPKGLVAVEQASACHELSSPYSIVVDGGSTGSRLHIFEFVEVVVSDDLSMANATQQDGGTKKCICLRRGTQRVNIPLSDFEPSHDRQQRQTSHGARCSYVVSYMDGPIHDFAEIGGAGGGVTGAAGQFRRQQQQQRNILNATCVAEHMLPLFVYAAQDVIPKEYHTTTTVTYQGTAGMRLLSDKDQEIVYDALYQGLIESDSFVFTSLSRSDLATLSGELEGFYGAVAANYLKGVVGVDLSVIRNNNKDNLYNASHGKMDDLSFYHQQDTTRNTVSTINPFLGALDMGGSSTQIVYLSSRTKPDQGQVDQVSRGNDGDDDPTTCRIGGYTPVNETTIATAEESSVITKIQGDDFFSTSYLSYGVDQFRERLWTTWVEERAKLDDQIEHDLESCSTKWISNPCSFRGHTSEWMGYTLLGTGNAEECAQQVKRLIPHPHDELHDDDDLRERSLPFNVVGGIQHPPIQRGNKFFAMSLYFFALDCLRVLSHNPSGQKAEAGEGRNKHHTALNLSWPTPSIRELYNALDGFCSRNWHGDLEDIQHNAHSFTRAEVLPHRCLESVYLVTLLKDGFGFHPSSRDITFTFLVDGSEVEWSLGLALVEYAEKEKDVCDNTLCDDGYDCLSVQDEEREEQERDEEEENVPAKAGIEGNNNRNFTEDEIEEDNRCESLSWEEHSPPPPPHHHFPHTIMQGITSS